MPTVEERVAYLEGKVEEHSRGFGELPEMVIHLDQKVEVALSVVTLIELAHGTARASTPERRLKRQL